MHEARWSRAKDDADKRRTGGSIFRAAIANARNERTSRLWARAALFEHAAAPGQARAAAVEQSAAPGSSGTRRAFCGSGEAREAPVEHSAAPGQARAASAAPSAAPGRARAAISSHLRPLGGLERPFRANMQQIATLRANMQQITRFRQAGHESSRGSGAPNPEETL